MPERLLLDTDIIVEFLRGKEKAVKYVENLSGELLMSVVTVAELWSGVKGEEEEKVLEQFLLVFRIVPVDEEIAKHGGRLRSTYGPSHQTGLADSLIAATTMREEAKLVTFNVRHFPMISGVLAPYRK